MQDQSPGRTDRFCRKPEVEAPLRRLPRIEVVHFEQLLPNGRLVFHPSLQFASKAQAKLARKRFI